MPGCAISKLSIAISVITDETTKSLKFHEVGRGFPRTPAFTRKATEERRDENLRGDHIRNIQQESRMAEIDQPQRGFVSRLKDRVEHGGRFHALLPGHRNREEKDDHESAAAHLPVTAAAIPESFFFDPKAVALPGHPLPASPIHAAPSIVSSPDTIAAMITSMEQLVHSRISFPKASQFSAALAAYQNEAAASAFVHAAAQRGGVDQLNAFLKQYGQSPLPPIEVNPAGLYGVGLFSAHPTWRHAGTEALIDMPDGTKVPGVHLKDVKFYHSESHRYPIAEVMTNNGVRFFVTQVDDAQTHLDPNDPAAATRFAAALSSSMQETRNTPYRKGLQIPMVDLHQSGALALLDGASIGGMPIDAAYFMHSLRIDKNGAQATSGAVAMASGYAPKNGCLVIDGPFVAWLETGGTGKPTVPFAALVRQRDMRDPAAAEN